MTNDLRRQRFEELDAGRVLGDLDLEETAEWQTLAAELRIVPDASFDRLAAGFDAAFAGKSPAMVPQDLTARLLQQCPAPPAAPAPPRNTVSILPWIGWAVAACLLGLLAFPKKDPANPPDQRLGTLISSAPDLARIPLAGTEGPFAAASGEIVWSDSRQEGYMSLAGIPANDPAAKQYQLWIVDPRRDEFPVDGGVFDIPAGDGPVIIPIDAKLPVDSPAVFVITLEQPGGVVRSKQETVVALAKL